MARELHIPPEGKLAAASYGARMSTTEEGAMSGANERYETERYETVIVGGGQAGLAAAYHLKQLGRPFIVLEANERVGDSWRKRWDSLRLFTPARFCKLPGLRFPAPPASFPTKDEMGDYLEAYARTFDLPVRCGTRIERLARKGDRYVLSTSRQRVEADNVIVASGAHQFPKVPAFAADLDPRIMQVHSSSYRSPSQLPDGDVLVVGLGNSGAEIGLELSKTRTVYVSGKPSAQLPFRHGPTAGRLVFPVIRFVGHNILNLGTPIGRKVQPKFVAEASPLIRVKTKHLSASGVRMVGRAVGTRDGRLELEDGKVLNIAAVIWCTGFRESFPWVDVPVFGDDGRPVHDRGVVAAAPGLYFMGLVFQYAASSDVLPGVGRDAAYVAKHIVSRHTRSSADERAKANV